MTAARLREHQRFPHVFVAAGRAYFPEQWIDDPVLLDLGEVRERVDVAAAGVSAKVGRIFEALRVGFEDLEAQR
jgi:hypothetical protein